MKITNIKIMFVVLVAIIFASCGGSSISAPPVDLPAPVTGRITLSASVDGSVTITGTAGAVTGGETVMAVNEDVSGTVSLNLLDYMIKSAYASEFPSTCSETGKACALADADGAFEMSLQADDGDSIVIGTINTTTGAFNSDLLRRSAGDGDGSALVCSSEGVTGAVVDIKIIPGTKIPVILKQGSSESKNQLIIGYDTPVANNISGCYAKSLALTTNSSGETIAVATSTEDKIVWTGTISETSVSNASAYEFDDEPYHAIFGSSSTEVLVSMKDADSIKLGYITLSTGGLVADLTSLEIQNSQGEWMEITGLGSSISVDTIELDDDGGILGLLTTVSDDDSEFYITLFDMATLSTLDSKKNDELEMTTISDAKLYISAESDVVGHVLIKTIDSTQTEMLTFAIVIGSGQELTPFLREDSIDNYLESEWSISTIIDYIPTINVVSASDDNGTKFPITKFVIENKIPPANAIGDAAQSFFAITSDGNTWSLKANESTGTLTTYSASSFSAIASEYDQSINYALDSTDKIAVIVTSQ